MREQAGSYHGEVPILRFGYTADHDAAMKTFCGKRAYRQKVCQPTCQTHLEHICMPGHFSDDC